jgi:hypothetical protein
LAEVSRFPLAPLVPANDWTRQFLKEICSTENTYSV